MTKATIIICLLIFISCGKRYPENNKNRIDASSDSIMVFGGPYPKHYAIEFVAEKWKLNPIELIGEIPEMDSISNKNFYKKQTDRLEQYNALLWKKLDSIYKIDSKAQFKKELSEEIFKINSAEKIFNSDSTSKQFVANTIKTGDFVMPVVHSKLADSLYSFRMWRNLPYGVANDKYDGSFADFIIDLSKRSVDIKLLEK